MQNYKQQFKGKKITIMGLGLLGRGIGDTIFLAECGADLLVTDLKTKEQLTTPLKVLSKYKNIQYVLGEHRIKDFREKDMIIRAAVVPYDSLYIREARKNNIPIEMDVSLLIKSAPKITVIGVTGTRGKSMTTTLIYKILKDNEKFLGKNVHIGGNFRDIATLPLLKKIKKGDILVCELDSWQLQGFGEAKVSPNISVFTTFMPDHMNYYKNDMKRYFEDKTNIYKYQKKEDVLIILPEMKKLINENDVMGKYIVAKSDNIFDWEFIVPGNYNRDNLACAVEVSKLFNIPEKNIKKAVANFRGLEGRMQLLKVYKGIKIYNDNNATTPEATTVGIRALANIKKDDKGNHTSNLILICGGADKNLPVENLIKTINEYCKVVVMIPGTGTDRLIGKVPNKSKEIIGNNKLSIKSQIIKNLDGIVKTALEYAKKGDIILFSPAFASFGMFNNEYERNDLFIKIIKKLK